MLGDAIGEVLQHTPHSAGLSPNAESARSFVGELEVRVGSLAIGYDNERAGYSIQASDFVSPFEINVITLLAARSDFAQLSKEIEEILAGSRPRCPLCGAPIAGQAHFCPPSNGHASPRIAE